MLLVDDTLLTGDAEKVENLNTHLRKEFQVKQGDNSVFLGVEIDKNQNRIKVTQHKFCLIVNIVIDFN